MSLLVTTSLEDDGSTLVNTSLVEVIMSLLISITLESNELRTSLVEVIVSLVLSITLESYEVRSSREELL